MGRHRKHLLGQPRASDQRVGERRCRRRCRCRTAAAVRVPAQHARLIAQLLPVGIALPSNRFKIKDRHMCKPAIPVACHGQQGRKGVKAGCATRVWAYANCPKRSEQGHQTQAQQQRIEAAVHEMQLGAATWAGSPRGPLLSHPSGLQSSGWAAALAWRSAPQCPLPCRPAGALPPSSAAPGTWRSSLQKGSVSKVKTVCIPP